MKYFTVSQQWVLFFIVLLLLGILTFRFYYRPFFPSSEGPLEEVVVEVLGEVRHPGVYLFQNPPTLREAIERAGGLKEPVLFDTPSSSAILETGTLLTVMKESSQIPPHPPLIKGGLGGIRQEELKIRIGRMAASKLLVFSIPLDLNQASAEDLCLIPGIGDSLAQEITAYRERRRGFRSVEELKNVRGVGGRKYETFKKFLAVKR
jgi:competence protein ComEA